MDDYKDVCFSINLFEFFFGKIRYVIFIFDSFVVVELMKYWSIENEVYFIFLLWLEWILFDVCV